MATIASTVLNACDDFSSRLDTYALLLESMIDDSIDATHTNVLASTICGSCGGYLLLFSTFEGG